MRQHKVSFRHACELLAKEHPALAAGSPSTPAPKLSAGKLRTAQTFSLESGDQALLDQVIEFYHQTLKSSPEALQFGACGLDLGVDLVLGHGAGAGRGQRRGDGQQPVERGLLAGLGGLSVHGGDGGRSAGGPPPAAGGTGPLDGGFRQLA